MPGRGRLPAGRCASWPASSGRAARTWSALQEAERNTAALAAAARLARRPPRAGDLAVPAAAACGRTGALHVRGAGAGPGRRRGEHPPPVHAVRPLPGPARGAAVARAGARAPAAGGRARPRAAGAARAGRARHPGVPHRRLQQPLAPRLDPAVARGASRTSRTPSLWPASATLAGAGFVDSYRAVHPDPLADPGFTWTPGGPEARTHDVFDRIDWVLAAGPATAVASRLVGETGQPPGRRRHPRPVPDRPPRRGLHVRGRARPRRRRPSPRSRRRVVVGAGSTPARALPRPRRGRRAGGHHPSRRRRTR